MYENTAYLYGGVNAKYQISAYLPCKHEIRRIGSGLIFLNDKSFESNRKNTKKEHCHSAIIWVLVQLLVVKYCFVSILIMEKFVTSLEIRSGGSIS